LPVADPSTRAVARERRPSPAEVRCAFERRVVARSCVCGRGTVRARPPDAEDEAGVEVGRTARQAALLDLLLEQAAASRGAGSSVIESTRIGS
jgi:hypothetical protein